MCIRDRDDSSASYNNVEMKRRTEKHHPRKHWNRPAPDKARGSSVDKDEELQTTLSQLSIKESNGDDVQGELDSVKEAKDHSTSTQPKYAKQTDRQQTSSNSSHSQGVGSRSGRNNRTRRGDTRFTKHPASHDDQQERADDSSSRAEKEPYHQKYTDGHSQVVGSQGRRNNPTRRAGTRFDKDPALQFRQDTVEDRKDSSYSTEPKFVKQSDKLPTSADNCSQEVGSESRRNNRTRRDDTHFANERRASQDDRHSGQDTVEVVKDSSCSTEQKCVQTSTDSSRSQGSQGRRNNHTRRGDTRFAKDPTSRDDQQERSDGSSSRAEKEPRHQKYTDGHSQVLGSQGRRNNPTRRDDSRFYSASYRDQYSGRERSDGSSSHLEKAPHQRKYRGGRCDERRSFHRESRPSSSHQHSHDHPTDKLTDVPSTKPDLNETG